MASMKRSRYAPRIENGAAVPTEDVVFIERVLVKATTSPPHLRRRRRICGRRRRRRRRRKPAPEKAPEAEAGAGEAGD